MTENPRISKHVEGCVYCAESSCQEHFERAVEDKVAALLTALLRDGAEYYADVLENQGYGPVAPLAPADREHRVCWGRGY